MANAIHHSGHLFCHGLTAPAPCLPPPLSLSPSPSSFPYPWLLSLPSLIPFPPSSPVFFPYPLPPHPLPLPSLSLVPTSFPPPPLSPRSLKRGGGGGGWGAIYKTPPSTMRNRRCPCPWQSNANWEDGEGSPPPGTRGSKESLDTFKAVLI